MHTTQLQFDEAEEQALIDRYGPSKQCEHHFELNDFGYAYWHRAIALTRRAEVVMAVQRPDGQLLLHTKGHYPPGTYRLPSGGVQWGESVLDALAREQWEELGAHLPILTMPGLIRYELHYGQKMLPFASYIFLFQADKDTTFAVQDPDEAISGFRWTDPQDLPIIIDHLHTLVRVWGNWGHFRAIAHELLLDTLLSQRTS